MDDTITASKKNEPPLFAKAWPAHRAPADFSIRMLIHPIGIGTLQELLENHSGYFSHLTKLTPFSQMVLAGLLCLDKDSLKLKSLKFKARNAVDLKMVCADSG